MLTCQANSTIMFSGENSLERGSRTRRTKEVKLLYAKLNSISYRTLSSLLPETEIQEDRRLSYVSVQSLNAGQILTNLFKSFVLISRGIIYLSEGLFTRSCTE